MGYGILIGHLHVFDHAAVDHMFLNDALGIFGLDVAVVNLIRIDRYDGTFLTEAEAAGLDEINLGSDAALDELALQIFDNLLGTGRAASGTAAGQNIKTHRRIRRFFSAFTKRDHFERLFAKFI